MENHKEKLLQKLRDHIKHIIGIIHTEKERVTKIANTDFSEVRKMSSQDQLTFMRMQSMQENRVAELAHLENSPYFTKCIIVDESGEEKAYYFAKHEFSDESIYSWIAPVAKIRFENPGPVSYKLPNGEEKAITIRSKEQYMIIDGKVLFFAIEDGAKPRELIYQEHFTRQKSEFALPEIVAQIEKAQDQVIRASGEGPLVISGPAGSGKTTLALHRVAYLAQSPDTSDTYSPESIAVFVQDEGAKKYFSTLLPSLGINDVKITTFSEWAFSILGVEEYTFMDRHGEDEEQKDIYEYEKLKALHSRTVIKWNKNFAVALRSAYSGFFSSDNAKAFKKQMEKKELDRFDLVILLQAYVQKNEILGIRKEYQTYIKDRLVDRVRMEKISYNLLVIDEFQNYLPEQLILMNKAMSKLTRSTIYVGDMAQQVKLGTIKNWAQIAEEISPERNVRLNKVYRNTKQILSYIKDLGYAVEIPEGANDGVGVIEKALPSPEEEIEYVKDLLPKYTKGAVGIIAKEKSYLPPFKKAFENASNVHVLSMLESQGLEFDLVCIVGMDKDKFEIKGNAEAAKAYLEERNQIQKDLLYVSLTRAISELHILGKDVLSSMKEEVFR